MITHKFITKRDRDILMNKGRKQSSNETYNPLKESDLRNRIFSPEFGLLIGHIVNHSITNFAIILISTSPQLKVNI